ncbi:golgin subfamily A member 6-like protein 22 [Penaeus chinensis]|uniref:golgin subfamily A member 6-like protein 22 n=1 Tax=Penaeus chinensis TaxID=139456 RepID=UPI001FB71660|nr:golgin subfamily A member 6-like protein 22 [Penaeus chinensis]
MWKQPLHSEGREQMRWDWRARNSEYAEQYGDRQEGTKALEDLHRQLQRETENLFRWKASSEVNTKQLERQLDEARVTIADQRRNLMELQLNSENLSQSLLKERQERDLIAAKVMQTGQLSLALVQQKEKLAGALSLLLQEKDLLSAAHSNTVQKINNLSEGLHDLCVAHRQQLGSITTQAAKEVKQLKNEITSKEQELNESEASLSTLVQHQSEYEQKVTELKDLLKTTKESSSIAREKNIALESERDEVKSSLERVRTEMEEQKRASAAQLTNLKEELKREKYRRAESQQEFEEAVEKIQYLKTANDTLEGSKAELLDKLEAVATRKQELEKDLQHGSSMLASLRTEYLEVTQQANFLSQCLEERHMKLSHLESDFRDMQTEKQSLIAQLDETKGLLHEERQRVCHQKEKILELSQDLAIEKQKEEERMIELETCQELNNKMSIVTEQLTKMSQENAGVAAKKQEDRTFATDQKISSWEAEVKSLTEQLSHVRNEWAAEHKSYERKIQTITTGASEAEAELKRQISEMEDQYIKAIGESVDIEQERKEQHALVESQKHHIKQQEKELKSKARALTQEIKKREKAQASLETWKKKFQNKENARVKLQSDLQETVRGQEEALKLHEKKQKALQEELQNKVSEISGLRDLARTHETNLQETQQKVVDLQEVLEAALGELNALRDTENARDKAFEELKCQSTEAKLSLTNKLQEKEEQLAASSNICGRLQADVASLKRCLEEQRSKHVAEVQALEEAVDEAQEEMDRAKQEVIKVNKEKNDVVQKADTKVKDMLSIIEEYRSENEVNMKKITAELLETRQKLAKKEADIANVSSANTKLLAEAVVRSSTSVMAKSDTYPEVTPFPSGDELATPSPRQYIPHMFCLRELRRKTPIARTIPMPVSSEESRKPPGILKTRLRRTLVPAPQKKRVVFSSSVSRATKDDDQRDSSADTKVCEVKPKRYRLRSNSPLSPRKKHNMRNQQAKTTVTNAVECSDWITACSTR